MYHQNILTIYEIDVICGSKLSKNRFFRFQSKVSITSNSKLKLDIVHLKTCITVVCHHSQTRTFWEWSANRICTYAFYNKILYHWHMILIHNLTVISKRIYYFERVLKNKSFDLVSVKFDILGKSPYSLV